jgi:hypothetical protein
MVGQCAWFKANLLQQAHMDFQSKLQMNLFLGVLAGFI